MPEAHRSGHAFHPLLWLIPILVAELLVILTVSALAIAESAIARAYTELFGSIAPAVRHFGGIGENAQAVMLCIALSPFFLVPKIAVWVLWLRSSQTRIYRYLVVTADTREIPMGSMDFVTDPLRSEKENRSPKGLTRISTMRAVLISVGTVLLALGIGIFFPFVVYGFDTFRGKPVDEREAWVVLGGWRLWSSWSVYQMNLGAGLLAIGYCVLVENFRLLSKTPRTVQE
jgi:hypothetical protein